MLEEENLINLKTLKTSQYQGDGHADRNTGHRKVSDHKKGQSGRDSTRCPFPSITPGLVTCKSVLIRRLMKDGEVVAIETYERCKLWGPRSNYLIKGRLRYWNIEVSMSSTQLADNKQVYFFHCLPSLNRKTTLSHIPQIVPFFILCSGTCTCNTKLKFYPHFFV